MATTALDEEKKRKAIGYAFPQKAPPGGSIYGVNIQPDTAAQPQPQGMSILKPALVRGMENQIPTGGPDGWTGGSGDRIQPQSDLSRNVQNTAVALSGLPGVAPIASLAGQSGRIATGLAGLARAGQTANAAFQTAKGIGSLPSSQPAQQAATAQGTDAKPYRDESLTATSARNLPAPQQPAMAATQPAQQGKDIGYGIRRIDAPGKSPLYVGDGPTPIATTQIMQAQPARRPVNMPVVGQGMGVFSSMANFANQAGNAMGAAMQNRASNRAAKAGLDAFRVQDEASTNDLRRQTAQAELTRAGQLDAARQEYLAAGDDPAKQKAAAKRLAVLSGKDGQRDNLKDNFIVVGGGQEYDQAAQTMRNVPQTLVDLRTGQPVALPAQQAQAGAKPSSDGLVAGQAYPRTRNGVTANYEYLGNGQWSATPLK